ncbi:MULTISPECIES: PAAR domain-containing protein [Pseudomonas]|uniref:PAAR domain-containing protein n=1 Tax=Pseudomonas wuhanensis TaxID=2954098 RepID=A0ABY9GSD8_9PSED|nr:MULTISPECIES: PAAR domain-containing protein [unclassified Pseudomonas]WLI12723.1 PAAR domain-containing protein [Pseudomonas sp. FP603]WLI18599.1 PAAR domain-containing protein [Pseudomonas sp. FP607]
MSGKPAARVSDPTACPLPGHGTNPIAAGSGDVFFDGLAAARQGDASACGGAMSGGLATTVLINGKPAATVDSVGTHGNKVTAGSGTVIIGNSHSPAPFVAPLPVIIPGFDEQFVLTDKSGTPMANRRYLLIRENGLQEEGVTSDTGLTHRVARHNSAEKVDIYVASED